MWWIKLSKDPIYDTNVGEVPVKGDSSTGSSVLLCRVISSFPYQLYLPNIATRSLLTTKGGSWASIQTLAQGVFSTTDLMRLHADKRWVNNENWKEFAIFVIFYNKKMVSTPTDPRSKKNLFDFLLLHYRLGDLSNK